MKWWTWILLLALIFADRLLEKKCPRVWKAIQLPLSIFDSLISVAMIALMIYSEYKVLISGTDVGGKVFFTLFALLVIGVFIWMNISIWKKWRKTSGENQ